MLLADLQGGLADLALVGLDVAPEEGGAAEDAHAPGGGLDELQPGHGGALLGLRQRPRELLQLFPVEQQMADESEIGRADVVQQQRHGVAGRAVEAVDLVQDGQSLVVDLAAHAEDLRREAASAAWFWRNRTAHQPCRGVVQVFGLPLRVFMVDLDVVAVGGVEEVRVKGQPDLWRELQ